jgi:subtilase family serine protease
MVSIGVVLMAAQGSPPAARVVAWHGATPACATAPAGSARCLGWFLQPPAQGAAGALGSGPSGYTPADLRSAYNLPAGGGRGRTVAVVDAFDDPHAEADLAVYRAAFGLPPCTTVNGCFRRVDEHGGATHPAFDPGWTQEISLDLDMVSAVCPDCHILLVEADGADMPSLGAAEDTAATAPGVVAVSNSFGSAESAQEVGWDHFFTHPGVAIVAASGDSGSGPGAMYPAASPLVTSVGGTSLSPAADGRGWTETAWHNAGSGCSQYEPKPLWQHDAGCTRRAVADVSAVADPRTGVAVYDGYKAQGWLVAGGTSAATPIIAAIYALAGNTRTLVGASAAYANPQALNDVTSGTNGLLCLSGYMCSAGPGYDGPTGMGTPSGLAAF